MFLFRSRMQVAEAPNITGVQVQSSVYGRAVPLIFGTTKVAPTLIWYGDFVTIKPNSQQTGKGILFRRNNAEQQQTTYKTALAMLLCVGELDADAVVTVLTDNSEASLADLGLTFFNGADDQTSWGYLTTNHPSEALNYRHFAYAAAAAYQLGTTAALPNHQFVVRGLHHGSVGTGKADAWPLRIVETVLYHPIHGAGFPEANVDDMTSYGQFTAAHNILLSPAFLDQRPAAQVLEEVAFLTHSEWVDSAGTLKLIPRGDVAKTGNGQTYTPPAAPLFDLTPNDFLRPPVLTRRRADDTANVVSLEVLNRSKRYNPEVVTLNDQGMIDAYGTNRPPAREAHMIADPSIGQTVAQFILQRQAIRNSWSLAVDSRFSMLEPMDIITITEPSLGLDRQWVRLVSIEEGGDDELTMVVEEYLRATGEAATYDIATGEGFSADYNAAPDSAIAPLIIEPPQLLTGELAVWIGTNGSGPNWGGAQVWISTDGTNYRRLGVINGGSNIGILTATLPAVTADALVRTVLDDTNTLSIDLDGSGGELTSSSEQDAVALNSLCWVDGELLAFATATPTGDDSYDLDYLVRGAYETTPGEHLAGSRFADLTGGFLKYVFTPERAGQTVYVKLLSYNAYGGGLQSLADVSSYTYTIQGSALSAPLDDVANFRSSFVDGRLWLTWDEVSDWRPVLYELRKGDTWESAQSLGFLAHPPVPTYGDGDYWIAAYSQPAQGVAVYSPNPATIEIVGSALVSNVIAEHDEKADGWLGTLSSGLETSGGDLRTEQGETAEQTYTIPTGNRVLLTDTPRACAVNVTWALLGQFWDSDFLLISDILAVPDFLGAEATAYVDGFPEMRLSDDAGGSWGAWFRYAPGVYLASGFDFRMKLRSPDAAVSAYLAAFTIAVDVPDRIDHITDLTLDAGGTAISFRPDGAGADAPFNGGPNGASTPNVQVTIRGATAGDDIFVTSLTLSGCTVQVKNGGSGVARDVDIIVQGY